MPSSSFPRQISGLHIERGYSEDEAEEYRRQVLTPTREMCASARIQVKKNFADNDKFNLPIGHPAVVFSESQMYHMLRAISDESVLSSFGLTRNLVLEATGLRSATPSRHEQRTASFRRSKSPYPRLLPDQDSDTDGRGELPSSEGESSTALNTDDCRGSVKFIREKVATGPSGLLLQSPATPPSTPLRQPLESPGISSTSSGQTLARVKSNLVLEKQASHDLPLVVEGEVGEGDVTSVQKPETRRKPKKLQVMKASYAEGMTWTKTFVCGPEDPINNKHKFFCQICKVNLSCKTKGALEVLRHHKTEKHLRKDQRWRYEHLKTTDPVTGRINYEVRDAFGQVLDPY